MRISIEIRYGLITSAFEAWIEHVVTGRPIVGIPTPEAPSPVRPPDTVFQPTQTARQDQARMIRPTDATLPWTTEVYGLLVSIGGISVASRFLTVNEQLHDHAPPPSGLGRLGRRRASGGLGPMISHTHVATDAGR